MGLINKKKKSIKIKRNNKKLSKKILKGGNCEEQTSFDNCSNHNKTCVWKSKYNVIDIDKTEAEKNEEGECHTNCKLIEDYSECMEGKVCRWIDLNEDGTQNKEYGVCF
jgi:hypothetical protein